MTILDKIAYGDCLVLDKRIDMWAGVELMWKNLGVKTKKFLAGSSSIEGLVYDHVDVPQNPPLYRDTNPYPTWINKPNAYNAFLSHKKMMERFLEDPQSESEYLLILEDDSFVEEDFRDILDKCEDFLEENHFDMLYFGGYHRPSFWEPTTNENVIKVKGSGGWHGVMMNKAVIESLLPCRVVGPYDWICGQKTHFDFDCYAVYPSIVSQADGHSFVEGHHLSKPAREVR